jgi:hypothetical protein
MGSDAPQTLSGSKERVKDIASNGSDETTSSSSKWTFVKLLLSVGFCLSAYHQWNYQSESNADASTKTEMQRGRRLLQTDDIEVPSYMQSTMADLEARYALFDNTPPQEIKYWFEYAGPLQVRTIVKAIE